MLSKMQPKGASRVRITLTVVDVVSRVEHTDKAVGSARAARKKRWICFGICILVLAIVAAIVAGVIATRK